MQKVPDGIVRNLLHYKAVTGCLYRKSNQFFHTIKNIPASDEEDLIYIGRMYNYIFMSLPLLLRGSMKKIEDNYRT
ncbi:MAG TPA: hypothetical protein VLM88_08530 [Proteiniclasticum sp.]|nr:hypothetical protein [Proteiniclasticum sp.]